jgi:hypothetical protein
VETVSAIRRSMLGKSRVSTGMAVAVPPASRISRATVEMVDAEEFGSGGKGEVLEASEMDFAATTTALC